MKITLLLITTLSIISCNSSKNMNPTDTNKTMTDKPIDATDQLTYLALGDSYTIGEGVSESGGYPNQLIERLTTETNGSWAAPQVIAQTGWTVDELEKGINKAGIDGKMYDLVTLSIGVNNQYRGLPISQFADEFETMLLRAISFAAVNARHVVVLSIPDWGVTPFAKEGDRDVSKIGTEIDAYNKVKAEICKEHGVAFIDITSQYRGLGSQSEMLAADGLHPSAKMYGLWTEKLFSHINSIY